MLDGKRSVTINPDLLVSWIIPVMRKSGEDLKTEVIDKILNDQIENFPMSRHP